MRNLKDHMKTLKTKVTILGFGGSTTAPQRETITTPYGPIYTGTPEAEDYLALRAYAQPLSALMSGLRSRQFGAVEASTEIAKVLPLLPPGASGIAETLMKLDTALRNGPVSPADPPTDWLVRDIESHVARCERGLSGRYSRAPKPSNPLAVKPAEGQRLGTGSRWHD